MNITELSKEIENPSPSLLSIENEIKRALFRMALLSPKPRMLRDIKM